MPLSIASCLARSVKAGEITKEEADDLLKRFDAFRRARASDSPADAEIAAKADLAADIRADALRRRRNALLAAKVRGEVDSDIGRYRTAKGRRNDGEAAIAKIEHYGQAPEGFSSVVGRKKAIIGRAHALLADLLSEFERTKLRGKTPNPARLDNIVRELKGESTGDAAAQGLAAAFRDVAEWLRVRFNRAGGNIGKLENWGLPQIHDARALVNVGKEAWVAHIRPLLAPEKMQNPLTGRPILEEDLGHILGEVYDTIVSDGWSTREPAMQRYGKGALANRRAEHRFLVFKDADAWLSYARDFGQPNAFAAMMAHINLMARDIAALEILGPNPDAMIEYMKQVVLKGAHETGTERAISRANRQVRTLDAMWKIERGATQAPVATKPATLLAVTRNWVSASVLGTAIASALPTDPIYQMMARRMAGLPAASTLGDIARSFTHEERFKAVRLGLVLDSAMHTLSDSARYVGTLSGPGWSQWLTDRVLTWSGLTPWTQAGRHAFGLEFLGAMAGEIGKGFDQLDPAFRRTFQRYGLGPAEWDRIRAAPLDEAEPGATFVNPGNIAATDEKLAERVLEMILQETEYAVPSGTLRGRAAFIGTDQPGTFWGEMKRSAAMLKSFSITYLMLFGGRLWSEWARSKAAGAAYAATLLATTTLGGAVSLWLKDVAAGRDPRPLVDENGNPLPFFGAAFLQGGGFGILSDFLFADINRYGGGFAATLGGPVVGRANDLWNLTVGNLVQLASGDDTNFGRELVRFVAGNVPGNTLWYLRAGYQRVIVDALEHAIDPEANSAFKRETNYWQNNYGVDLWWQPGHALPSRAPDLGAGFR